MMNQSYIFGILPSFGSICIVVLRSTITVSVCLLATAVPSCVVPGFATPYVLAVRIVIFIEASMSLIEASPSVSVVNTNVISSPEIAWVVVIPVVRSVLAIVIIWTVGGLSLIHI